MAVGKGRWSNGWLKSGTERVCIMNVRLVCVFASSSCIGAEPAAYVEENVESRKCDFRAVIRVPPGSLRQSERHGREEQPADKSPTESSNL